jgi:hypothetical protein
VADTTSASSGAGSQRSEEPTAAAANPPARETPAGTGAKGTEPQPEGKGKLLRKLRRKLKSQPPAPVDDTVATGTADVATGTAEGQPGTTAGQPGTTAEEPGTTAGEPGTTSGTAARDGGTADGELGTTADAGGASSGEAKAVVAADEPPAGDQEDGTQSAVADNVEDESQTEARAADGPAGAVADSKEAATEAQPDGEELKSAAAETKRAENEPAVEGNPEAEGDPEAEATAGADTEAELEGTPAPDAVPQPDASTVAEAEAEVEAEPEQEADAKAEAGAITEADVHAEPEAGTEIGADGNADADADAPNADRAAEPEAEVEAEPDVDAEPKADIENADTEPEADVEPPPDAQQGADEGLIIRYVGDMPADFEDIIIGLPKPANPKPANPKPANPEAAKPAEDPEQFLDHEPPNHDDVVIGRPDPTGEQPGDGAEGNKKPAPKKKVPKKKAAADQDKDATAEDADPADGEDAEQEQSQADQVAMALITALMRLREALASSHLPIDVVGADEARQQKKAMLDQLDDYVLPRLVQLEAPVLAVVGGSTGAGKSTLVNTLVGRIVSEPGVLRPTTRSPVLVHNPVDSDWFTGDRVLPGLARSTGDKLGGHDDPGTLRLVAADAIPQGLAILDAPDIDSVVEANRELAAQLLAAADLWLFVTTAARYADAVPWDFLKDAAERSTAIAVVLDRVPPDSIDDVSGHLAHMLLERGLGDSPMFVIAESEMTDDELLPDEAVAQIKEWLTELAADASARAAVVRRTLQGAVTAMTKKTPAFAAAVRAQSDTVDELRSAAETAYVRAVKDVSKATQDGSMLRGEVLARWQEFVGTGELLKGLQTNVGRLRDRMRNAISGRPQPTRDVTDAVESGLESLLREHAEAAAERAEESWQSTVAGRQLLEAGERDLGRASRNFNAEAGRMVREWQGYVLELVRKEGADKRSAARLMAYGFNGLGIALMIVIFASTAGIPTGAEVGVGAGTAAIGQKLLEAVFGDQAVRTLAAKARRDLDSRVRTLMDAELSRYLTVLDQHPVDPDAPRRLTEAARAVEDCT